MGRGMREVQLSTGLSGENLAKSMQQSEQIMKNLFNAGNLNTQSAKAFMEVSAEGQKMGVDLSGMLEGLSDPSKLIMEGGQALDKILMTLGSRGGEFLSGQLTGAKLMKAMADQSMALASRLGGPKTLEGFEQLGDIQKRNLNMQTQALLGMSYPELLKQQGAFKKGSMTSADKAREAGNEIEKLAKQQEENIKTQMVDDKSLADQRKALEIQKRNFEISASTEVLAGLEKNLSSSKSLDEAFAKGGKTSEQAQKEAQAAVEKLNEGLVEAGKTPLEIDFKDAFKSGAKFSAMTNKIMEGQRRLTTNEAKGVDATTEVQQKLSETNADIFNSVLSIQTKVMAVAGRFLIVLGIIATAIAGLALSSTSLFVGTRNLQRTLKTLGFGKESKQIKGVLDNISNRVTGAFEGIANRAKSLFGMGASAAGNVAAGAATTAATTAATGAATTAATTAAAGGAMGRLTFPAAQAATTAAVGGGATAAATTATATATTATTTALTGLRATMTSFASTASRFAGPIAIAAAIVSAGIGGVWKAADAGKQAATIFKKNQKDLSEGEKYSAESAGFLIGSLNGLTGGLLGMFFNIDTWIKPLTLLINKMKVFSFVIGIVYEVVRGVYEIIKSIFVAIWEIVKGIGGGIWNAIEPIFTGISDIFNSVSSIFGSTEKSSDGAFKSLRLFGKAIDGVAWFIVSIGKGIGTVFKFIGSVIGFVVRGIMKIIEGIVIVISSVLAPVVEAISSIFEGFYEIGKGVYDAIAGIISIFSVLGGAGSGGIGFFGKMLNGLLEGFIIGGRIIGGFLRLIITPFTNLIKVLGAILSGVGKIIQAIVKVISGDFSGAGKLVKDAFLGIFKSIKDVFTSVLVDIPAVILKVGYLIVKNVFKLVYSIFSTIVKIILAIPAMIFKGLGYLTEGIASIFLSIPDMIFSLMSGIIDVILSPFKTILNFFSAGFGDSVVGSITSYFGIIFDVMTLPFKLILTAYQSFGKIFSAIGKLFSGDFSGAASSIGDVLTSIPKLILKVGYSIVKNVYKLVSSIFNTILSIIFDIPAVIFKGLGYLISGIASIFLSIPDMMSSLMLGIIGAILYPFKTVLNFFSAGFGDSIVGNITSVFGTIFDVIMLPFRIILTGIKNIGKIFSAVGKLLTGDFSGAGNIMLDVLTSIPKLIWKVGYSIVQTVFKLVSSIFYIIVDIIFGIPAMIYKGLGYVISGIGRIFSSIPDMIKSVIFGIVGAILYPFKTILNFFGKGIGDSFIKRIKSGLGFIIDILYLPFKIIGRIFSFIGSIFSSIGGLFSSVGSLFSSFLSIFSSFGSLSSSIGSIFSSIKSLGTLIWDNTIGALAGAGSWVWDNTIGALAGAGTWIWDNTVGALGQFGTWLYQNTIGRILSYLPSWLGGGGEVVETVASSVASGASAVVSGAVDLTASIEELGPFLYDNTFGYLEGLGPFLYDNTFGYLYGLGQTVYDEFAYSISYVGDYVQNTFMEVFKSVSDYISSMLPGLETSKAVGESVGEAFGSSEEENIKRVQEVGSGTASGIGRALGGVTELSGSKVLGGVSEMGSATWGNLKSIVGYAEGSKQISETGLAVLHKDEIVIPSNEVEKFSAPSEGVFDPSGFLSSILSNALSPFIFAASTIGKSLMSASPLGMLSGSALPPVDALPPEDTGILSSIVKSGKSLIGSSPLGDLASSILPSFSSILESGPIKSLIEGGKSLIGNSPLGNLASNMSNAVFGSSPESDASTVSTIGKSLIGASPLGNLASSMSDLTSNMSIAKNAVFGSSPDLTSNMSNAVFGSSPDLSSSMSNTAFGPSPENESVVSTVLGGTQNTNLETMVAGEKASTTPMKTEIASSELGEIANETSIQTDQLQQLVDLFQKMLGVLQPSSTITSSSGGEPGSTSANQIRHSPPNFYRNTIGLVSQGSAKGVLNMGPPSM
jgi:phage-related protein